MDRQARSESDAAGGQVGAIQGAVLGLLELLLAFSFAAAGSRFVERQDLIVAEANANGTSASAGMPSPRRWLAECWGISDTRSPPRERFASRDPHVAPSPHAEPFEGVRWHAAQRAPRGV